MSLKFDVRCYCAGCNEELPPDGAALAKGGQRVSESKSARGREVLARVSKPCAKCLSYLVRIVTSATVEGSSRAR